MRIAIIGCNGQLGRCLSGDSKSRSHTLLKLTHEDIQVEDYKSVSFALGDFEPEVIINTAAYHSDLDYREKNWETNVTGAYMLAKYCESHNSCLIHISTDYVFDGQSNSPYDEESIPSPINEYGISKFVAESILNQCYDYKSFIVRISTLFGKGGARGKGGRNFIDTVVNNLNKGEPFTVHSNVFVSPSYAVDVSSNIYELIKGQIENYSGCVSSPATIFHFSNKGYASLYEISLYIKKIIGSDTEVFESKCEGNNRPKQTALTTNYIMYQMPSWESGINRYLENDYRSNRSEI